MKYKSGIYQIVNKVNDKRYIGSSSNIDNRRKKHLSMLKSGSHENSHIQRSYNKYSGSL